MRIDDLVPEDADQIENFSKAMNDFLPLAIRELEITSLPKIKIVKKVEDDYQPTFGKFLKDKNIIYLAIKDRHIIDILRTLAHELVHYKQNLENRLDAYSGKTGSPTENEAHEISGIIMRHFNKKYEHYFDTPPIKIEKKNKTK
jgi:Zn-dependent peptidase ImmA (M78 family)